MKLFPAFQLLGILSILTMGQTIQNSFSQNMTNETGVLPIPEFQPRENSVDSDDSIMLL